MQGGYSFAYDSHVVRVAFSIAGSDETRADSTVVVSNAELFKGNVPSPSGVYDGHLGTTDYSYPCETCGNNKHGCLGHEGMIKIKQPVLNPVCLADTRKWLKSICHSCGKPVMDDLALGRTPISRRLDDASKVARSDSRKCAQCGYPHPFVMKSKEDQRIIIAETRAEGKTIDKWVLYPHKIREIFARITDETVIRMGKPVKSHPRKFVLDVIRVPPVTIRPDIKKLGASKNANDDLTVVLQALVKANDKLPAILPDTLDADLEQQLQEFNNTYHEFVLADGENVESLGSRLKGKEGRLRRNQMGKRAHHIARSTIVNNARLKLDQVGIPTQFARTLQMDETVQDYNRARLIGYVLNGRKRYPGATKIIKRNGKQFDVESAKDINLENGDIVMRDLITGDVVAYNRQPSLMISNITTHRIVVTEDPAILALLMNVLVCPLYGADFDGDQMSIILGSNLAARIECAMLGSVANHVVSHKGGAPLMGQSDDSIIGSAQLTRDTVKFDKPHYAALFATTDLMPRLNRATYTGRDSITEILSETPIDFNGPTFWYNDRFAPWIKYKKTETTVSIREGVHISGILDYKTIGKGGSLYRPIISEYGPEKALDFMFNLQQLAISYIMQRGYSIGVHDLMIGAEAKAEIDKIVGDLVNESNLITEQLSAGSIVPPVGKTVREFYESKQITTLTTFDEFAAPVMKALNPENNLLGLVLFKSKGSFENMLNMVSAIGQKIINLERIKLKFGHNRTLPYFRSFETTPESRGYISNSYLAGMCSTEYIFNAMASRFDLIMKALVTSETGDQNRKSIKSLEGLISNNYRWSVKTASIVQFAYGEDFQDPRAAIRCKFPTVAMSDEALKKTYLHPDYPGAFKQIQEDRKLYRERYTQLQDMSYNDAMTDSRRVCVDVLMIFGKILDKFRDSLARDEKSVKLQELMHMLDNFYEDLPYVLINDIQRERKGWIPDSVRAASWLIVMLCRSHLHPNKLVASRMSAGALSACLDMIRIRYITSLIDPGTAIGILAAQSFSEPFTQYMLDAHHRSATGGSSRDITNKVREVLGAKGESRVGAPKMFVAIREESRADKNKVAKFASAIEMLHLRQFVDEVQIFYEDFGNPLHPLYAHEAEFINEFAKKSVADSFRKNDLAKWCLRFVLDKMTLVLKNISVSHIAMKLRESYPYVFACYTPDTADQIVMRIYFRLSAAATSSGQVGFDEAQERKENLLNTIVRGIDGISLATPSRLVRSCIMPDGSMAPVEPSHYIATVGTNMSEVMTYDFVDRARTHCSSVPEMARLFGIEAARMKIIYELRGLGVEVEELRHYLLYADEMTHTGTITSIEAGGVKIRGSTDVLLRAGFSAPVNVLTEASINGVSDNVNGITAPLLLGTIPKIGTLYNSFHIDEDFVKKNSRSAASYLEDL